MRGILATLAATAVCAVVLPGMSAENSAASPGQKYHYVGPNGSTKCHDVAFPQANWFHSRYGGPNRVTAGYADSIIQLGGLFYVGYVRSGQVDIVLSKSAQTKNAHVGGPALSSGGTPGGSGTYYKVDTYRLYAGACQQATDLNSRTAIVGMPFPGKWAYNALVHPVNGEYNDATSSHPSVHHAPGGGDWATDLYAAAGEPVRLHVSSTGGLSFVWEKTTPSCAGTTPRSYPVQGVVIGVKVNGVKVGEIYYTHLVGAVDGGPIKNGMVLGRIADPAKDGGCNPGSHVHIELKNTGSKTHACWADHGLPGAEILKAEAPLGILGSKNRGKRQACAK